MTTAVQTSPSVRNAQPRVVAWLINGHERYGVRRATIGFVDALWELGWRAPILSLDNGAMTDECEQRGLQVHRLNVGLPAYYSESILDRARVFASLYAYTRRATDTVVRTLEAVRADIIHVRWPTLVHLAGRAGKRAGARAIWHMPNLVGSRDPLRINKAFYQAVCFKYGVVPLANSAYTGGTLGTWPVRPVTFHLGIDERQFDPSAVSHVTREALGIPLDAVVFGICGRVTPDKGQDRVLRAVLAMESDVPLHLVLVGRVMEEAYGQSLRNEAHRADAADRLHILGAVEEPERYYQLTDVQINARIGPEPFGLSVIEAMMMGRPVLVHALGGPRETVLDGVTGWHIPDVSHTTLLEGLRRAMDDRARWPQMGVEGRRHAVERFSSRGRAAEYTRLANGLLVSRSDAAR